MKRPRVLYIGLKNDYGDPHRSLSYEYVNFFDTLQHMSDIDVRCFPFDEVMRADGRDVMNKRLVLEVEEWDPDLCFFALFTDEISADTIKAISRHGTTVTLNWFGDDHWRFVPFSRHWAPCFHWSVTTDGESVCKYQGMGYPNVIHSQWAVNHYRVPDLSGQPQSHDATFIGQIHSKRKSVIGRLQRTGIPVECWGKGWPNGRLSQDEMYAMFVRSRINLNFTDSSVIAGWKPWAKIFLNRRADDSLHVNRPSHMADSVRMMMSSIRPQIKGRNFEIPGVGGFLLTSDAQGLSEYFTPGKEVAVFAGFEELVEKIRYYLAHPDEREAIRRAGTERVRREHTYEQRFREIFRRIGLFPGQL